MLAVRIRDRCHHELARDPHGENWCEYDQVYTSQNHQHLEERPRFAAAQDPTGLESLPHRQTPFKDERETEKTESHPHKPSRHNTTEEGNETSKGNDVIGM